MNIYWNLSYVIFSLTLGEGAWSSCVLIYVQVLTGLEPDQADAGSWEGNPAFLHRRQEPDHLSPVTSSGTGCGSAGSWDRTWGGDVGPGTQCGSWASSLWWKARAFSFAFHGGYIPMWWNVNGTWTLDFTASLVFPNPCLLFFKLSWLLFLKPILSCFLGIPCWFLLYGRRLVSFCFPCWLEFQLHSGYLWVSECLSKPIFPKHRR